MALRVLLVEPHHLLRQTLACFLAALPCYDIVGDARDGPAGLAAARTHHPQLVVTESRLPGLCGVDLTSAIIEAEPQTRVVMLFARPQPPVLRAALAAGALALLPQNCSTDELLRGLEHAAMGRPCVSPALGFQSVAELLALPANAPPSVYKLLSDRERQVLQLVSEGRSNKEIAGALYISIKTVDTHRQHIMHRLNIHRIAGLTRYAIREGLTPLD